jgi:hypothetical protein
MRAVPVVIEADGRLRISPECSLPAGTKLAVFALDPGSDSEDISSKEIARWAEAGGSFDFLKDEPDLYSDEDIEPGQRNPDFRRHG